MVKTHCVKSVQIRSYFWSVFNPNTGKYGPEITPYLDTFHAVSIDCFLFDKDLHHERVKKDFVATVVRMWLISILQETFSSFNNSFTFSSYGARTLK